MKKILNRSGLLLAVLTLMPFSALCDEDPGTTPNGPATFSPLPDSVRLDYGTCYPGFPHGIQGTLRVNFEFVFNYAPKGDRALEAQKGIADLENRLKDLASANSNGPQFIFVDQMPFDLSVRFTLYGRGNGPNGNYTAYWGGMETYAKTTTALAYMFGMTTQAYDATDEEDLFSGGWSDEVLQDASTKWYSFIANGWTCN